MPFILSNNPCDVLHVLNTNTANINIKVSDIETFGYSVEDLIYTITSTKSQLKSSFTISLNYCYLQTVDKFDLTNLTNAGLPI